MSEIAKTVTFIAVAAASLVIGLVLKPSEEIFDEEEYVGERLNQFEVGDPQRLKIVKFDSETATTNEFEVAAEGGLWTIPSKQGYPADAAEQMAEAATCLIDRQILQVAATTAGEHSELGVVDPSSSGLGSGEEGVGIRVIMTNTSDEKLVDMIIGKPVKDAEGQRFVRNTNQDIVYVVELNPEKLTTQFEDWIEDDLLQINPMDIRHVRIKDYSAALQPVLAGGTIQMQVNWDQRAEMELSFDNSAETKWTADSLRKFDPGTQEFADLQLAEDEELNEDTLSELRTGLDDLLLVDVERKPEGLSSDLKAGGDFLNNNEAIQSLVERGFAPVPVGENSEVEILSSEGEVICTLDSGVEYVLRFGNLNMDGSGSANSAEPSEEETSESGPGIHRYLFVMARFNEDMIEKPELAELPALPEGTEAEATSDAEAGSDEENGEASEEDEAAESEAEEESEEESAAKDESEAASDEEAADEGEGDANETSEKADELQKIIAERKAIETENQRKLDQYQEKIKSGNERVQELNERFGDWYYVISNDVYKQIHLNLESVIRKKEKEEGEGEAAENAPASNAGLPAGLPGLPNLPVETEEAEAEGEDADESKAEPADETEPEADSDSEDASDEEAESEDEGESESEGENASEEEAEPEVEPAAEEASEEAAEETATEDK